MTRAWASRRRAAASLGLTLAALACAHEPAPDASRPPALAQEPTTPAAPQGPLASRYKTAWAGWDVRLLGLNADASRAWLWKGRPDPKDPALVIEEVDLTRGLPVGAWRATPARADAILDRFPTFRPLSGSFEEDLVRFAALVRQTGPWSLRARALTPSVASPDDGRFILHEAPPDDGKDGDWLILRDAQGHNPRRLDVGLRASYNPQLSPDGARVAWRACSPKHAPPGANCGYVLALASLGPEPTPPTLIPAAADPTPPVWSADGASLWVVDEAPRKACLLRVPTAPPHKPAPVACAEGLRDLHFQQDPTGVVGLLAGWEGDPQAPTLSLWLVSLPDGASLGRAKVEAAAGPGLLVDHHRAVVPLRSGGVRVLDLPRAKHADHAPSQGRLGGLEAARLAPDGRLILLQTYLGGLELVALDLSIPD
jgi:hypothetical protein